MTTFLGKKREDRHETEVRWVRDQLIESGCVDTVRSRARSLADEAHAEAVQAFGDASDSADKRFLLELPYYMVSGTPEPTRSTARHRVDLECAGERAGDAARVVATFRA